jgi:hypothetical protein
LLTARCGVNGAGLTRPQLRALLSEDRVAPESANTLLELLERCDVARFSSTQSSDAEMQATLLRATGLVSGLGALLPTTHKSAEARS